METKYIINGDKFILSDNKDTKSVRSENYNYNFNKVSGRFMRWGAKEEDDPDFAPSPEILDIEVTTKCNGINGKLCPWCYKSNTPDGKNMSLATFKKVIDSLPHIDQEYVQIELGNKIINILPNSKIKLINGKIILASEIKDGDNVVCFL